MNVKFYYNEYPPNKVDKGTDKDSPILTIENVRFKDEANLSIQNPTLILAPNGTELSSWGDIVESARFNYFYIPKFCRFYFITDIFTNNGLIEITGKCDVLNSFKDDILASSQYITRSQSRRSAYLSDSMLPIRSDHRYIMKPFGKHVDDKTCSKVLMITTGKGGNTIQPNA